MEVRELEQSQHLDPNLENRKMYIALKIRWPIELLRQQRMCCVYILSILGHKKRVTQQERRVVTGPVSQSYQEKNWEGTIGLAAWSHKYH
jgi:hypothetical protein